MNSVTFSPKIADCRLLIAAYKTPGPTTSGENGCFNLQFATSDLQSPRRLPMDLTTPHARALVSVASPELLSRMRHGLEHLTPMPPSERLDALLRDQECRWDGGECVGAEVYRQAAPQMVSDDDTLLYLISGELHLRGRLGDPLNVAEYRGRFPHLGDSIARQIEVETALLSQEQTGEIPSLATATFEKAEAGAVSDKQSTVPGFEVLE